MKSRNYHQVLFTITLLVDLILSPKETFLALTL